jgi:Zn-dependent protease with chaperone function
MTDDEFRALATRLEGEARRNARGYEFRVWLLAMLGNAYLALVVLLLTALFLGALASMVWLKFLLIPWTVAIGAFLWVVLRALWVNVPPPEGIEVRSSDAPTLFAMIDELGHALRAPRFHQVLIDERFNAGVVQTPRLGIFGWERNHLLIGLPLMKSLSVDQLKAVLAHEFGHLSRGHGRISNWIYRKRLRWVRVIAALEERESMGWFLFKPFLIRYAPYFNAYSFPLARANEYEADAAAARLTFPTVAAEALTSVSVAGRYLSERFWPALYKRAEDSPQPAFAPYASMAIDVSGELGAETAQTWLEQALAEETGLADTHPSLADRLAAIGESARLAPPERGQTADRLLGEALPRITDALDARWHAGVLRVWEARHREVQEGRLRLGELDARAEAGDLPLMDALERARLGESFGAGPDAALEEFRALHARAPDDALACYALGARLLARDDETGLALVEGAMQRDPQVIVPACESLRDYCWRNGREQEARDWHTRMVERAAAARERSVLLAADKLQKHGLADEIVAGLCSQLQAIPEIDEAYLVRKRVKHLPEWPCYVLGFRVADGPHRERRIAETGEQIAQTVRLPDKTLVLSIQGNNYWLRSKLRQIRGARILDL